jgi:hypothetical protein
MLESKSAILAGSFTFQHTPSNSSVVRLSSQGDSAIAVSWTIDTSITGMKHILYGFAAPGKRPDSTVGMVLPYHDTAVVIPHTLEPGLWHVVTVLLDTFNNLSQPKWDSVVIANSAPRLFAPGDTTISQGAAWTKTLVSIDINNDSIRFHIVKAPPAMTIDSLLGTLSWTPGAADTAQAVCIVSAGDSRGSMSFDTFAISVRLVNLPPRIVFFGDSIAFEDRAFHGRLALSDPNQGDSARYVSRIIPGWMLWMGDSLSGIPAIKDLGVDTLVFIAIDKGGLSDTLRKAVAVLHTDHSPELVSWNHTDTLRQYDTAQWSLTAIDKDKGDSLFIVWSAKPAWISVIAPPSPQANERLFKFVLSPSSAYRGWYNFTISLRDTSGALVTLSDSVFIVGLPVTVIAKRQIAVGAVAYAVTGSNGNERAQKFEGFLRNVDDTSLTIVKTSTNGNFLFYPLLDGRYEFQSTAVDAQGRKDPHPPKDAFTVSGASHHTFADSSWTMLSVPCASYPAVVLAGSGYLLHWDESADEQELYRYYRRETAIGRTCPGSSYWRKSVDTLSVTLKRMDLFDSATTIKLDKNAFGWNQIASPYPYPVQLPAKVSAWKWNGALGDYEDANGILEPWQGYWVMVDSAQTLRMDPAPCFSGGSTAKRSSGYFASTADWRVKVSLRGKKSNDADNCFGFSAGAGDAYDISDRPEPPRLSDSRYVFFWHPEWGKGVTEYASDIRRQFKEVNTFQIGLAPSQSADDTVRLRFQGIEMLSSLYCFCAGPDTIFPIQGDKDYTFAPSQTALYKTIFVSPDKNFLKKYPFRFGYTQPFPNPARLTATVSYTLPYRFAGSGLLNRSPYTVRLTIYDIMGRKVRQLLDREQQPGSYRVVWDGKSVSGRVAASGAYFFKLDANEYSAIMRLTMVR